MDAFRGILEVELDALVDVAGVARHDDGPARVRGGHGCHVEALLPLLVDPLEGERVRHLAGTTSHVNNIALLPAKDTSYPQIDTPVDIPPY